MSDELEENNNLSFLPTPLLNSTIGKKSHFCSPNNVGLSFLLVVPDFLDKYFVDRFLALKILSLTNFCRKSNLTIQNTKIISSQNF